MAINKILKQMNNIWFQIIIYYLLGIISFLFVDYLIHKFSKNQSEFIFTNGITSKTITFIENYQEILNSRLGNDPEYFVSIDKTYKFLLLPKWTIWEIKKWMELLEKEQDYVITIELVPNNSESLNNSPRITLSRDFMINYNSDPVIISTFIAVQLNSLCDILNINNENHFILIHYATLKSTY